MRTPIRKTCDDAIRAALAAEATGDGRAARTAWWQAWHLAEIVLQDEPFAAYCAQGVIESSPQSLRQVVKDPRVSWAIQGRALLHTLFDWIWWGHPLAPLDLEQSAARLRWRGLRAWGSRAFTRARRGVTIAGAWRR